MNKADELTFQYIARDKIDPLNSGFHWASQGRSAFIYIVEEESIIPIYCEMPGVGYLDVLVFGETEHITKRYYIDGKRVELLSFVEKLRIQDLLVRWLAEKGLRHDINVGQ